MINISLFYIAMLSFIVASVLFAIVAARKIIHRDMKIEQLRERLESQKEVEERAEEQRRVAASSLEKRRKTNWHCRNFGHKFVARYDEKANPAALEIKRKIIEAATEEGYNIKTSGYEFQDRTYVCDICKRCGCTIRRK